MKTVTPPHISIHTKPKRQLKLWVFTRLVLMPMLTLAIIFVGLLVFAKPAKADEVCRFVNAGMLEGCFDATWKYEPNISLITGYPTFVENDDGPIPGYLTITPQGPLYCKKSVRNPIVNNTKNPDCGNDGLSLTDRANATLPFEVDIGTDGNITKGPFCSMINPKNCLPWDGDNYSMYNSIGGGQLCKKDGFIIIAGAQVPVRDQMKPCEYTKSPPSKLQEVRDVLAANALLEPQDDKFDSDCIDSPLSFFICPVGNFLYKTLVRSIEIIVKMLQNPVLTGNSGIQNGINGMINLANSFYVLIFLIIIIANFIAIPALDNYTIKKTLPKLFWAVIFTQFSLLICQMVLDIGNILGETIPTFILSTFGITGTPAVAFADSISKGLEAAIGVNFASQLGNFALLILTMLVGILIALVAFIYILARYLFLVGLVLSCPLAFAAWVLPNTEQFFKTWWKYFVKLSIMFLLVNLLFVLGAVFVQLLTTDKLFGEGFGPFISGLIAVIIPIIILLLVPKTLKVSGSIMTAAKEAGGKALSGAKESRVGKAVAKSGQEGKLAEVKGGAMEKFGKSDIAKKVIGGNRAALMEAKGAQKKDVVKEKVKGAIDKLDFDRQLAISKQGGKAGEYAGELISKKRDELANKRVLNDGDVKKLEKLYNTAKPGEKPDIKDPRVLRARAEIGPSPNKDKGEPPNNNTINNPFWTPVSGAGGDGGDGGGGRSGEAGLAGLPGAMGPPPPPPPAPVATPATSRPTTRPAGTVSGGLTERATAAPARPDGVIPGTGGAVDLSRLRTPARPDGVIPGTGGAVDLSRLRTPAPTGGSSETPPASSTPEPPKPPPSILRP